MGSNEARIDSGDGSDGSIFTGAVLAIISAEVVTIVSS